MIAFRAMPVRDIDFPYKQISLEPIARAIRRQQMVGRMARNPLAEFVFRVCDKVLSYKTVRFAQDAVEEVQAKANDASAITGYDQESDDLHTKTSATRYLQSRARKRIPHDCGL